MMKKNKIALLLIVFMAFSLVITSVPSLTWAEDTLFKNSEEGKVAIKDDSGQTPIPEEGPEVPGLPGEETPNLENSILDDPNPAAPDLNNPDLPDQNIDEETSENEPDSEALQVNPEYPEGLLSNQDEQEPNESENAEQENTDAMEENGNSEEGGIAENLEFEISEELEIERLGVPNTQSTVPEDWSAIFLNSSGEPIFPKDVTKEDAKALINMPEANRPELLLEFDDDPVTLKKSNKVDDYVENVQAVILRTAKAYWNLNHANNDQPVFRNQNVTLTVLKNISLQSNGGVIPLEFKNVLLQSLPGSGNQFVLENGYDSDPYSDTLDVIHIHSLAGNVFIKNLIIDGNYLGPGITFDNSSEHTTTKTHLILDGNVTVRNCGETGAQSRNGSNGIWMSAGTSLTMRKAGNKIENCISPNTSTKGSAIFVNAGCTVTIDGASFENNQSQNQGGAIYSEQLDSQITVENTTFSGNSAVSGGAIYSNSILTLTNCSFAENTTTKSGGAVFLAKDTTKSVQGCDFSKNKAGGNGGAIFVSSGSLEVNVDTESTKLTRMTNFEENNATSGRGGAIYFAKADINDRKLIINNTYFKSNFAQYGGAIYSAGSIVSDGNAQFIGNYTLDKGYGGAIYLTSTGTAKLQDTKFQGNKAYFGGGAIGVNNITESSLELVTAVFNGNISQFGDGGAIWTYLKSNNDPLKIDAEDKDAYSNLQLSPDTIFTQNIARSYYQPPQNYYLLDSRLKVGQTSFTDVLIKGTGTPRLWEDSILNNYDVNYSCHNFRVYVLWEDENNKDGLRPDSVAVKLLDNGSQVGTTLTVKSESWKDKFDYTGDVTDKMSVVQEPLEGYTTVYAGNAISGFVIVNMRKPVLKTITFDANGGAFADGRDVQSYKYEQGEEITIIDAPTREGYTFDYWQGSEYQPGDKYTVVEDHTFVAQWKSDSKPSIPDPSLPDPTLPTPSEIPEIVLPGPVLPRPLTVSPPAVVKQIKGGQPAVADYFTFRLEAVGYKALAGQKTSLPEPWSLPLPQDTANNSRTPEGTATLIQIQGAGSGLFGQITYAKPGDYTYKITEVPNPNLPYNFASTVYTFTDHVYEQDDQLVSDRILLRDGQPINSITAYFTNEYTGPNSLQEQVQQLPATGAADSLPLSLFLSAAGLAVLVYLKKQG